MKKLLRTLFVMIVVGLVVAGVASYMSKKRLEAKSDDEIREFLAKKLDGKVGEASADGEDSEADDVAEEATDDENTSAE